MGGIGIANPGRLTAGNPGSAGRAGSVGGAGSVGIAGAPGIGGIGIAIAGIAGKLHLLI